MILRDNYTDKTKCDMLSMPVKNAGTISPSLR